MLINAPCPNMMATDIPPQMIPNGGKNKENNCIGTTDNAAKKTLGMEIFFMCPLLMIFRKCMSQSDNGFGHSICGLCPQSK